MPITYYLTPNNTTTPTSYSVRVVGSDDGSGQALLDAAALAAGISSAQMTTALQSLQTGIAAKIEESVFPNVPNYGRFTLSVSAKMSGPNDRLPTDARLHVNCSLPAALTQDVQDHHQFERIEAPSNVPQIEKVSAKGSTLVALQPNQVLTLEGLRLYYHENASDEGVFFTAPDGTVYRATPITDSDKKAIVLVPTDLPTGVDLELSLVARTSTMGATSPVRTGVFATPVRAA